jgi:hypothetical protein
VAKNKTYTTAYRDAMVFRDANGNGVLDEPAELPLRTGADGAFSAPGGKGRFLLTGGFDIDTGEANPYALLSAPKAARSLGPLTSLWQSLLDRGASQNKIKKLVGVPLDFSLNKYAAQPLDTDNPDRNQERGERKEGQVSLLTQWVSRIADTTFGARFAALGLAGEALKAAVQAAEDKVIGDFAQALLNSGQKNIDLSDQGTVRALLGVTLAASQVNLTSDQLDQASQAASAINAQYREAPADKLDELAKIADNSAEVFAARDFGTLVDEYTGTNLDDQVQTGNLYIPAPTNVAFADDTGASATDRVTRDDTPAFAGRVDSLAVQVNVYRDGAKIDSVPASNGAWSYASPSLADGHYSFAFKGVNALGNEGAFSRTEELTVDTAPPAVPTVTPVSGTNANPTVRGTWKAGAGERLSVEIAGQTYTEGNGLTVSPNQTWSVKLAGPLDPGVYDVIARATDVAGNVSADASSNELVVNGVASGFTLTADAAAGVPAREGGAIVFSIAPNGGALTAGATLSLKLGGAGGQATAADFNPSALTVSFAVGDAAPKAASVAVFADGLKEGVESYSATLLDAAGNVLATFSGLIDDPPNQPPAVSGVADIAGATGVALALPNLAFSDADGDALTVTLTASGGTLGGVADADPAKAGVQLTGSPAAVTAAFAGATFSGANAGLGSVGVSVSDGTNPAVPANIGVTLTNASIFELGGPATAVEGSQAVYAVTRVGDLSKPALVDFVLVPGSGASKADYGAPTVSGAQGSNLGASGGTLSFAAGAAQATIALPILADGVAETGETLFVGLSANPSDKSGGTISLTKGSATVALQDAQNRFALNASASGSAPTPEGDSLIFTVTPNGPVDADTALTLKLEGATVGSVSKLASTADFNPSGQTINFKAGDTAPRSVVVTVASDGLDEGLEGYRASLLDGASKTVASITGLIDDSGNSPPVVSGVANVTGAGPLFALPDLKFSDQDNDTLTVTATATGGALGDVTDAAPSTPGVQLVGSPAAVTAAFANATFFASEISGNVAVSVSDGVNPPVSANIGVTVTASPANSPPVVSGATNIAGVAGAPLALPNLAFSDADNDALTVTVTATGGILGGLADADAATPGVQLVGAPAAVTAAFAGATFAGANAGVGSVDVSVSDGFNPPVAANIGVTLTASSMFELSGPATAVEGNPVTYTVTRVGDSSKAALVDFALLPGGGASQADYAGLSVVGASATNLSGGGGTLAFPAGSAQATISLSLLADGIPETGETLTATLLANSSDTSGATVSVSKGSLTVALQDPPPTLFTLSSNATAGGPTLEGDTLVFTVAPSGPVSADTTLTLNLTGAAVGAVSNPASPADFSPASQTIGFKAGDAGPKTVSFLVFQDNLAEGLEGYKAALLNGVAELAAVTGVISDRSDAAAPVVSSGQSFSYTENQSGSVILGKVAAFDDNGIASFAIVAGNDSGHFVIDNNGLLNLSSTGLFSAANDFETLPNAFVLSVVATDAAGNASAPTDVGLNVLDIDDTPPTLSSVAFDPQTNSIFLNFDETLDPNSIPQAFDFGVKDNGGAAISVTQTAISGAAATLGLSARPSGSTIFLSYFPSSSGVLQDLAGNDVASFSAQTATGLNQPPAIGGASDVSGFKGTQVDLPDLTFSDPDSNLVATVSTTSSTGFIGGLRDMDTAKPGIQLIGTPSQITSAFVPATISETNFNVSGEDVIVTADDGQNAPVTVNIHVTWLDFIIT